MVGAHNLKENGIDSLSIDRREKQSFSDVERLIYFTLLIIKFE